MSQNRGKQFEDQVRKGFEAVPNTKVIRLIDPQNGFAGVRNMCDFVVYKYPNLFLVECKSCYGNTLSISTNDPTKKYGMITNNQWEELKEAYDIRGVIAGYMIWFIDHDITVFVKAGDMVKLKESGAKSFNIVKAPKEMYTIVPGVKKRILFDYKMAEFMSEVR